MSSHLYLKLEENSPKISHENKVTSKRLCNDTPEYMYDHLGDKHSSNGVEDDTYHHAAARLSEDASDYDTMGKSSVNNASDQDATYDHAHTLNNCHSDYGYNVPKQNCFNDNPYDIAGERWCERILFLLTEDMYQKVKMLDTVPKHKYLAKD